jgi:hypothetical protein
MIVDAFLKSDARWSLFVDADSVLDPDASARLVSHNVPVVSGLAAVVKVRDVGAEVALIGHAVRGQPPLAGLYEAKAVGMGFTLIHRDVLASIGRNHAGDDPFVWFRMDSGIDGGELARGSNLAGSVGIGEDTSTSACARVVWGFLSTSTPACASDTQR